MSINLEDLGLTKEEIRQRVIDGCIEAVLGSSGLAEHDDGDVFYDIHAKMSETVAAAAEARVQKMFDEKVLPSITEYIENLCLQETNKWGEAKGEKLTFVEYLVSRAENYLREEVNFDGKPKGRDSYSWRKMGTRAEYLIDNHLAYNVERAMKSAVQNAHTTIAESLNDAVRIAIANLNVSVKTDVTTK